jgi:hypothetical protein
VDVPGLSGRLVRRGDEDYDRFRAVWNGAIDRRPLALALCEDVDDVAAVVRFAGVRGLPLSVKGGGHGVSGSAVCEDGIVVELSRMRSVRVDERARLVRAGAGVLWGELDQATQAFKLATTGGIVSHTGVAGLTLGGGIGWLMRQHGLTIDNLVEATVVLADGGVLTASERGHADLFWGLRGAGANLGVVTEFVLRLHAAGPTVLAGPVVWEMDDAPDVLRAYRDLIEGAPRAIGTTVILRHAPPLPALPVPLHGRPVCIVILVHTGRAEIAAGDLAPFRAIGAPLADLVAPRPYVEVQRLLDAANPHGWHYYWKALQVDRLNDHLLDTMVQHSKRIVSPRSYSICFNLGGAVADVPANETAYAGRTAGHDLNICGAWLPDEDPGAAPRETAWVKEYHADTTRHSTGVYVNFLDRDDHHRIPDVYGDNHDRLLTLKSHYDPDGLLRPAHAPLRTHGEPEPAARPR